MLKVAEAAAEQEQGIGMVVVKGLSVNRENRGRECRRKNWTLYNC